MAILAELDALINRDHPLADKDSGAVHACGHFAQLAQLVGAAVGLKDIMKELAGRVVFFAVPSAEFINLEFRQQLKDEGKIKYFGGSTDMGDLTQIKPGIHPFVGSFSGDLHSKDFEVVDRE